MIMLMASSYARQKGWKIPGMMEPQKRDRDDRSQSPQESWTTSSIQGRSFWWTLRSVGVAALGMAAVLRQQGQLLVQLDQGRNLASLQAEVQSQRIATDALWSATTTSTSTVEVVAAATENATTTMNLTATATATNSTVIAAVASNNNSNSNNNNNNIDNTMPTTNEWFTPGSLTQVTRAALYNRCWVGGFSSTSPPTRGFKARTHQLYWHRIGNADAVSSKFRTLAQQWEAWNKEQQTKNTASSINTDMSVTTWMMQTAQGAEGVFRHRRRTHQAADTHFIVVQDPLQRFWEEHTSSQAKTAKTKTGKTAKLHTAEQQQADLVSAIRRSLRNPFAFSSSRLRRKKKAGTTSLPPPQVRQLVHGASGRTYGMDHVLAASAWDEPSEIAQQFGAWETEWGIANANAASNNNSSASALFGPPSHSKPPAALQTWWNDLEVSTQQSICQYLAVDYCCLNYPLPLACEGVVHCHWRRSPPTKSSRSAVDAADADAANERLVEPVLVPLAQTA